MREILEKFPKAVLIEFALREGGLYRFDSGAHVESRLLYFQWEQETGAANRECDDALEEQVKHHCTSPHYWVASKRWDRAHARWMRAQLLLEKSKQLRGR